MFWSAISIFDGTSLSIIDHVLTVGLARTQGQSLRYSKTTIVGMYSALMTANLLDRKYVILLSYNIESHRKADGFLSP
jgi:hypothetical protein